MSLGQKIRGFFGLSTARSSGGKGKGEEHRIAIRRPQRMKEAYIWSSAMVFAKPCRIRDISASGARIELGNEKVKQEALIGLIVLFIPSEKQEIDCLVKWRSGRSMGLEFKGCFRSPTRSYSG